MKFKKIVSLSFAVSMLFFPFLVEAAPNDEVAPQKPFPKLTGLMEKEHMSQEKSLLNLKIK
ncbi:hypothetical protein [Parageobacillus toebii]|uniref:hypothetical protein n=1 Tax=Parageobacillus toebii TaxID=153151 RepID=UPI001967CBEB|nr:hypothetical protein [Parageobacillus toebii]QSB48750.1 hypothetical protein JTI59_17065 [Parageobacillus toebii]